MHQLHRIFCATPWECERERARFHELTGAFNESNGIPRQILFVPVSLVNIRDKRPLQYAVDENIRDCRYYIQVLTDDWGPVERNFKDDYRLALESIENPDLPLKAAAVLAKKPLADGMPEPDALFSTIDEFDAAIGGLLAKWLESFPA